MEEKNKNKMAKVKRKRDKENIGEGIDIILLWIGERVTGKERKKIEKEGEDKKMYSLEKRKENATDLFSTVCQPLRVI